MRLAVALLVVCACGRFNFEGSADAAISGLAITSPAANAEVAATASLTGTCVTSLPLTLAGAGLASPNAGSCTDGAFEVAITFTDGTGPKAVEVTQGTATVTRTFVRVSPVLASVSAGTAGSAGIMIDCDLVIAAPPGLVAGDLVLGMIYSDGGPAGSITSPGFTRSMLAGPAYVAFWKIATAAEPATYTFHVVAGVAASDTCESAGVVTAWSGVDAAMPILTESGAVDSNDTMVVAPAVTTVRAAMLVGMWGSNGPASGFTIAGMIVASEARSPGDYANALIAYQRIPAGPTGTRTAALALTRPAAAGLFAVNGVP